MVVELEVVVSGRVVVVTRSVLVVAGTVVVVSDCKRGKLVGTGAVVVVDRATVMYLIDTHTLVP